MMYHTAFNEKYDTSPLLSSTHSKQNCSEIGGGEGERKRMYHTALLRSMIHLSFSPPLIPNTTGLGWGRQKKYLSFYFPYDFSMILLVYYVV